MSTKELALRKALAEEGILIVPEGRYTDRLRVGEQRLHVLRLSRQAVEKITRGLPYQSGDIAPKTLSPMSPPFAGRG